MRGISRGIAVAILVLLPALVLSAPVNAKQTADQWTVMVYIDADNNLEPYGLMNLQQLESVGSSDTVNFVVLIDTLSGPASLLYIEAGESRVLEEWGEVDMADPATMTAFIKAVVKHAPAARYAFISWDHGGGWRGLNWDDTTGPSAYTDMGELRKAVVDGGVVFDVFALDQCLMAQPEVAYQLRGYADYLVFSEETIYGQGFPYDMMAADLVSSRDLSALDVAMLMVEDFAEYYNSITWANDWTISAFDMTYMDDVTDAITHLASASLNALGTYKPQFKNAVLSAPQYYYPYYVDLKSYAVNLLEATSMDAEVREAAEEVVAAVDGGIVLALNSKHNIDSTGLSIYLPTYKGSYLGLKPDYVNVPFAVDTGWLYWLQAFAANK